MKFKWKYIAWILPTVILYAGSYVLYDNAFTHWWGFPTTVLSIVGCISSIVLTGYLILEDK